MAHNLEFNSARGTWSMYSRKEVPWHNLGQIVADAVDPIEAMKLANLDYQVALGSMYASFIPNDAKQVVQGDDGKVTIITNDYQELILPAKGVLVPDVLATYRTDTYDVLGTVGKRYNIVQNDAALEFIYDCMKSDSTFKKEDVVIETAGALGKGERIFVTAKLPDYKIESINEDMERYILFTTSHDGSSSIQAMFTDVRVVCNNTLTAAIKGAKNVMNFRHTKNVAQHLQAGAKILNASLIRSNAVEEVFKAGAAYSIQEHEMFDFIGKVFLDTQEQQLEFTDAMKHKGGNIDSDIISTKKVNVINNVLDTIDKGVGQASHRGTALWIYNGITSYLNNTIEYKSDEDRFNSLTNGLSYRKEQLAMNTLIQYAV